MVNGLIDFGSLRPNAAMEAYQQGQQNQLAQMQLAQQQQAIRDAEAEREAYKGASSFGEVSQRLMQQGLGKQALAVSAAEAKQRADKIALLRDTTALMKTTATQIMADPTIAESALVQFGKQTGHDITNDLAQLRALGGDPDKTRLWAASHALEADKLLPKFETRDLGGTVERQGYNVVTGKAIGPADVRKKTATPGELMTDARARERLAAETATGELSPQTIDFVAETYRQTGQLPPLGMGKAAVNMRQKILDRAAQLAMGTGDKAKTAAEAAADVKTAKADTAAQASAIKDFSSGMSARRVTANNTAINHLATMENLADDLANSDTRVFNAAANAIAKQFGAAAPANFDAARQLVASEVIKAVVANGGGVTERQEAAEQFARANSPAQLKGVINTYKELLGGQLSSLGQQYETGTGRKDFNKKLSPETRKILEKSTPQTGALSAAEQAELEQLRARFKK